MVPIIERIERHYWIAIFLTNIKKHVVWICSFQTHSDTFFRQTQKNRNGTKVAGMLKLLQVLLNIIIDLSLLSFPIHTTIEPAIENRWIYLKLSSKLPCFAIPKQHMTALSPSLGSRLLGINQKWTSANVISWASTSCTTLQFPFPMNRWWTVNSMWHMTSLTYTWIRLFSATIPTCFGHGIIALGWWTTMCSTKTP